MKDARICIDHVTVRYRDSGGSGPAVLMLHGIGGSLELWSAQFVEANQGLRLIALDLPGHGLSDFGDQPYSLEKFATFAWKFADTLGLGELHLVGNSMGGAVSLLMLDQQPARVRSILLAAAATLGRESPLPFRLMTLPGIGALLSKAGPMAVKQQIEAIFDPSYAVPRAVREVIERNVMRPGAQTAFLATLRQMTELGGQREALLREAGAALRDASVPVLLLHGREDRVIPCAHSEAARALNPMAQLQVIDGCGHTPQLERAEQFGAAMRDLVARAEAPEPATFKLSSARQ